MGTWQSREQSQTTKIMIRKWLRFVLKDEIMVAQAICEILKKFYEAGLITDIVIPVHVLLVAPQLSLP